MRSLPFRLLRGVVPAVLVIGLIAAALALWAFPPLAARLGLRRAPPMNQDAAASGQEHVAGDDHAGHDHEGHDHEHPGHDENNALELSKQAESAIGLKTVPVELKPFAKTISVPGIVVERPGRSTLKVTSPLTGVVTKIYAVQGESLPTGSRLFDLRLTHEELVQAQGDLLRFLGELDVARREVDRLERLTASGAVAGKERLDRQYDMHKLEAAIQAQSQALTLHGLTAEQIESIVTSRKLFQSMTVYVPDGPQDVSSGKQALQVQRLSVQQGQQVQAGEELCVMADYSELQVEGMAFERDADSLQSIASANGQVTAIFEGSDRRSTVPGLHILYVAGQVDPESRALHFYVRLPNERLADTQNGDHEFVNWRFRPGQRLRLTIPVETWPDQIVLPAESVVQEGPESFVFVRFGDHFDRRPVQILYRDAESAVVDAKGALKPGEVVAADGAQQLQLALKNKAGGGVDPHAGHNH